MKRILGLDLGTTSIGWALVNEAESENEISGIVKLGVRVNPLTVDEMSNFEKGKSFSINEVRRIKRGMRRNLQRYKLRREFLIKSLTRSGIITDETILSESGPSSTFETYRLRAKAACERIELEEFARVLLMINKKRGYKSNRKIKDADSQGSTMINSIDVARKLYDEGLTPGELCKDLLKDGQKRLPDFYKSDLHDEFERIWQKQKAFYPEILTDEAYEEMLKSNKVYDVLSNFAKYEITKPKKKEPLLQIYSNRVASLTKQISIEDLASVISSLKVQINKANGYLGNISDRSKILHINNITVGQFLLDKINNNPSASIKNNVFYRQDYLDEFEVIWEQQAKYHAVLTPELKEEIRDIIIFYQRKLKSQKGSVGFCEFESSKKIVDGKEITIGAKVAPCSHPIFQEFKIWQVLNNLEVSLVEPVYAEAIYSNVYECFDNSFKSDESRKLEQEEKEVLARELFYKGDLSKSDVLKILFKKTKGLDLNFDRVSGNKTTHAIFSAFAEYFNGKKENTIDFKNSANEIEKHFKSAFDKYKINTDLLKIDLSKSNKEIEKEPLFRLWHLLYSYEGDNSVSGVEKLIEKLKELCNIDNDCATILANVTFENDYGNLSVKAMNKILPFMKEGERYDLACAEAGYRHSKSSLTKEEIENKVLKDKLSLLPKNSLRNPVVEKILNQMVNVVNSVIDTYGKPDEIRVELARELKKSTKEREDLNSAILKGNKENEAVREVLRKEFNISNPSKNDVIRYKLYQELKVNGYKTLYSNKKIDLGILFSNEIDIEHIIPQARLLDDSFSNKTLEFRDVNIEKGNRTAYDYVASKYGPEELEAYKKRCEAVCIEGKKAKLRKLMMTEADIPDGFIERDLRETQYISKKALEMLNEVFKTVTATTGSITDELRNDWQLVDLMKELNLPKYEALGEVSEIEDSKGHKKKVINDWTKRNDHRHHAVDALTVAFTKSALIQYYNYKNAAWMEGHKGHAVISAIKAKYFEGGKAKSPIPLTTFRAVVKRALESLLVSIKSKTKVVTKNKNRINRNNGPLEQNTLTPRGELHEETVRGCIKVPVWENEKIGEDFDAQKISRVADVRYRIALSNRLKEFNNDPKAAFSGKNSLTKKPINCGDGETVPQKVLVKHFENVYTVRKPVDENLNIEKVVDSRIRQLLKDRVAMFKSQKEAFADLENNPIWVNKERGIALKRVTIGENLGNAVALHYKKNKDGKFILDKEGNKIPVDFVKTGNNHHAVIYRVPQKGKDGKLKYDKDGNLEYEIVDIVVPFYEAVRRKSEGLDVIDKNLNKEAGWEFLFSMKQNEYFVFPNEETGFDPTKIDLKDPKNYSAISPNLYRVQKFSQGYYLFRHHLETTVKNESKEMKDILYKRIQNAKGLIGMVKVRVNHIGEIVDDKGL